MADCVADQTAKHGRYAVCGVVYFEAKRLLCGCIPDAHHEDETGVDGCFERAEEETVRCYAGETGAGGGGDEDYAPAYCGDG